MWLTHFSPSLVHAEDYMPQVREIFPNAFLGKDGKSVELMFEDEKIERGIHMKKNGQKIIFAVVCVVIIVGLFWYTAAKKGNSAENNDDLTEVEKVITKNLEKNYPETPREVVKFYNRIITCFYDEEYTDDELYELGDQARLLMDDELLENNSRDDYLKA